MEAQDPRSVVKRVHERILRITNIMKVVPFVYSALFILVLVSYTFTTAQDTLDTLFYISPIVVVMHLVYSYVLELCIWHRVVCAIPLIPQGLKVVDDIVHFTQNGVLVANIVAAILSVVLLYCAHKVFTND